jgi:glycosyltransferase involved in cell wall biosynthesis
VTGSQTATSVPHLGPAEVIVWLDVTDLVHWRGTLTGIQRTQYNLCLQLSRNVNVKFFQFLANSTIIEVPLPDSAVFGGAQNNVSTPRDASLLSALKRAPLRLLRVGTRVIPLRIRLGIKRRLASGAESVRDAVFIARGQRPATELSASHPFARNETVIFLGVTWSIRNHQRRVAQLREELGLVVISTVYDLIPLLRPQFFGQGFGAHYGRHLMDTMSCSDLLLSISESTTADIKFFAQEMKTPLPRIVTFRLGDVPEDTTPLRPREERITPNDYILSVGTIEVRKNYDLLYRTWDQAVREGKTIPTLVIVGRPGWLTHDVLYQIRANKALINHIIVLSHANDDELIWLYQNCLFTIYPSWYEGWGLPIAESAKYGKFCLASKTSSMPEIAGALFDYFDPADQPELLRLVMTYVENRDALKEKTRQLSHGYIPNSWSDSARFLEGTVWPI